MTYYIWKHLSHTCCSYLHHYIMFLSITWVAYGQNRIFWIKTAQVFGHIDNTHSSYLDGLTQLTTYQNTWQIHTFPFCISCSCLLTHTLSHISEEHTKTAISKHSNLLMRQNWNSCWNAEQLSTVRVIFTVSEMRSSYLAAKRFQISIVA